MIRPYFLDVGVRIIHMLLMSWAGEEATSGHILNSGLFSEQISNMKHLFPLREATDRAVNELRQHGVDHRNARRPNVLWNEENGRVMMIDFERSRVVENGRGRVLGEISENRRGREGLKGVSENGKSVKGNAGEGEVLKESIENAGGKKVQIDIENEIKMAIVN